MKGQMITEMEHEYLIPAQEPAPKFEPADSTAKVSSPSRKNGVVIDARVYNALVTVYFAGLARIQYQYVDNNWGPDIGESQRDYNHRRQASLDSIVIVDETIRAIKKEFDTQNAKQKKDGDNNNQPPAVPANYHPAVKLLIRGWRWLTVAGAIMLAYAVAMGNGGGVR